MLTARKSPTQLTDTEIDFQIDNYYTGEFPLQFRSHDLRQEYSMTLTPNQDVYTIDGNSFQSVEPICYVEGYPTLFVMDRTLLHALFPDIRQDVSVGTGTGVAGPYTFTTQVPATPILKGSVLVYSDIAFDTQTSVVDDRTGNLVQLNTDGTFGTVRGTINYQTGVITALTFDAVVPTGTDIRCQSRQYQANRPTTVFYWVNEQQTGQLTFRPVPDKAYNIRIVSYNYPILPASSAAVPILNQWWEALAYGASMKIFENNKDLKSAVEMEGLLERKLNLLGRTEWIQLRSQGTKTIYNTPMNTIGPGYGYFGYFGNNW